MMVAASKLLMNSVYDVLLEICTVNLPQWFCMGEMYVNKIYKEIEKLYTFMLFIIFPYILFQNLYMSSIYPKWMVVQ